MPFARRTVQHYVNAFLAARKKDGILKAYESMFLRDREKNLDSRLEIECALRDIDELLKNNLFFVLRDNAEPEIPMSERALWLGRIPDQITGKYHEYRQLAEEILRNAQVRELTVSDLLRDRAVAESTQSNIRLQQAILVLTLLAAVPILYSAYTKVSPYGPKIMDATHRVVLALQKIHIHRRP